MLFIKNLLRSSDLEGKGSNRKVVRSPDCYLRGPTKQAPINVVAFSSTVFILTPCPPLVPHCSANAPRKNSKEQRSVGTVHPKYRYYLPISIFAQSLIRICKEAY